MIWSLVAAAFALQPSAAPEQRAASPFVRDIIAGYKAWETTCTAARAGAGTLSCSTQSSDQITTIGLVRTAAGLSVTLESRRCPSETPAATRFIAADLIKPVKKPPPYLGKRTSRVYKSLMLLEDAVLKSCGLAFDAAGKDGHEMLFIDRFLRQSDVVAGTRR